MLTSPRLFSLPHSPDYTYLSLPVYQHHHRNLSSCIFTHTHTLEEKIKERNSRLMELDDDHNPASPHSLKSKLKDSLCFYCCFRRHHHGHRQVLDSPTGPPTPPLPSDDKPTLLWLKARKAHDLKDDIKDKCMMVFGRVGNGINRQHKRHPSAEFRYDPLSYSLNFEDGFDEDDEYPLRNFSARLPPSQPVEALPAVREIAAISCR